MIDGFRDSNYMCILDRDDLENPFSIILMISNTHGIIPETNKQTKNIILSLIESRRSTIVD
jgi:hypothetical protein